MRRYLVYLTEEDAILAPETCSVTTSAFFVSHDIRRDVRLYIATKDYSIILDGSTLRLLRPDAQSTRGLLRKVLQLRMGGGSKLMPKGFTLLNESVEKLLNHLPNTFLCFPAQKARKISDMKFGRHSPALIVGEDRGKALEAARASHAVPIRLSRYPLPASHEFAIFNILLDRIGMIDGDSTDRRSPAL